MMKYLVGTSGWNYPHWKGKFYPSARNWLQHYSSEFTTVEVNYSFYRWPKIDTLKKWHSEMPGSFRFTLKAPRFMTHMKKLRNVEGDLEKLYLLGDILDRKMGCYLFQLPPDFGKDNISILEEFLEIVDSRRNNVIEFRNRSWWDGEVKRLLERNNVAFCTVSGLGMPQGTFVTSRNAYFRFHGRSYSTRYSSQSISKYAGVMKKLDARHVYAYFNNDRKAYAPANAKELREALNA